MCAHVPSLVPLCSRFPQPWSASAAPRCLSSLGVLLKCAQISSAPSLQIYRFPRFPGRRLAFSARQRALHHRGRGGAVAEELRQCGPRLAACAAAGTGLSRHLGALCCAKQQPGVPPTTGDRLPSCFSALRSTCGSEGASAEAVGRDQPGVGVPLLLPPPPSPSHLAGEPLSRRAPLIRHPVFTAAPQATVARRHSETWASTFRFWAATRTHGRVLLTRWRSFLMSMSNQCFLPLLVRVARYPPSIRMSLSHNVHSV